MPTSDIIFFVIGVADYLFLLLFIAGTGIVTRREARAAAKHELPEAGKRAEESAREDRGGIARGAAS